MKYLLITFSFLVLGITSQAQVKTNASDCTCTLPNSITKPSSTGVSGSTVNLQWGSSFGYEFHVMYADVTSGGFMENTATINTSNPPRTGTANNLAAGHTYIFYVEGRRTCQGDFCNTVTVHTDSPNSDQITLIPAVPSPSVSSLANNQFQITYPGVYGITTYALDVATDAGFTSFIAGYNNVGTGGATDPTVFNLSPGTTYWYRVRSVNNAGTSASSTAKSVVTLANVPALTAATSVTTTSFTANWSAATGASSYQIDVATDAAFNNIVAGYSQLSVTGTSKSITGLAAGTTYFYRLRSMNSANAASAYSTSSQQLTLPAKPVLSSSAITTNSYSLNWTAIQSATGYQLDVATDEAFTSFLTGYNSKSVTGVSINIASLTAGTNYYARLRAVNATGLSAAADVLNTITVPSAPVATAATTAGTDRFTANWNQVTGAASYRIDVATDEQFTAILASANNVSSTGIAKVFTALSTGTTYYYRVRAVNAGGTSTNSNTISKLTLPAIVSNLAITDISATTMKASWNAVPSVTEYNIYVSRTLAFDDILEDYNPLVVSNSITEKVLNTGLQPATVYYLRVRGINSTGGGGFSETKTASTLGGDNVDIQLTDVSAPVSVSLGTPSTLSFKLDGGTGNLSTKLYHRKKTESNFTSEAVTAIKGNNTVVINDTWLDDIGMEFYIETTDDGGHIQTSATKTVLIQIPGVVVPVSSFGKEINNYHIISVPYDLTTKKVTDLFQSILGDYNEAHWRLVRYKDGKNQDYRDGLSVSNIERGAGYWFISKDRVDLQFGSATTFDNSLSHPFILPLKKGWNQIGNPINQLIKWDELISLPENSNAPVSTLLTYVHETISLNESNELKPFEGGFVYADENTELTFPVTLNSSGGRKTNIGKNEIEPGDWILPIQIAQDQLINNLPAIGMNHAASNDKDALDLPTPPSFVRYVDFTAQGLSRNIIRPTDSFTWNFSLTSSLTNPVTLTWDNTSVSSQLIMHDKTSNKLINMNRMNSYVANPSSEINIYYNKNKTFERTEISLGIAYPNPFKDATTIPFDYNQSNATLVVIDLNGAEVARLTSLSSDIEWNGKNSQGISVSPGMYVYRLYTNSTVFTGKIIKQ